MTLLSDRLNDAGVNTSEARLVVLAVEALRESDGSLLKAASALWEKLEKESWVAREVWLLPYLRDRKADMTGGDCDHSAKPQSGASTTTVKGNFAGRRKPSPARIREVTAIAQRAAAVILFKHRTSDGRDWARVGAHELDGMGRDGVLAQAIHARLGALSNSQRFKEIGELMTPKTFNEVRGSLKE